MNNSKLTNLFLDLITIPSPSGEELLVAKFIRKYLDKSGLNFQVDKSGKINKSNSGNLIVKLNGNPKFPRVLFVAHIDTVETGEKKIQPVIKNGIIKSRNNTILGADDKASVACLIQMLVEVKNWEIKPNIIVAFTTHEEKGMMGASLLSILEKIDYCFNVDGSNKLGDFVYQTLGEIPFEIKIIGKASHAAVEPEKGINAIKTAASLITKLKIGKDKKGNVLNIGKIIGGTGNNIVPDEVILYGQVRSYAEEDLIKNLDNLEFEIKQICKLTGCSYKFIKNPEEGAPPATTNLDDRIIDLVKKASRELEISPILSRGSYTSDSNFLSRKYPTLTVGRGSKFAHSFDEEIGVKDLNNLYLLLMQIVRSSMDL